MVDAPPAKPGVKVRLFRLRNRLKDKTAGLGGNDAVMALDADALAKAEEALASASQDYPQWALQTVAQMTALHKQCQQPDAATIELFDRLRRMAHDLKGQGGTFGYPLVTSIAQSLHRFVSPGEKATVTRLEIIKSHIDALRVVLKEQIKSEGGDSGKMLLAGLQAAIRKHES